MHTIETQLKTGLLRVNVARSDLPVDSIIGFGSRPNKLRGFSIVSKVLGKHVPVSPQLFRNCVEGLVNNTKNSDRSTTVIGMAETATGLGHAYFEQLLRSHPEHQGRSLYLHTTRHVLEGFRRLSFKEHHSHAPDHWLHLPNNEIHRRILENTGRLVLVDDEHTTGKTALGLVNEIKRQLPNLSELAIVCLTNFMKADARIDLERQIGLPVSFVSLLEGDLTFSANKNLAFPSQNTTCSSRQPPTLSRNFGRTGISKLLHITPKSISSRFNLNPQDKILILGTGEFQFPAFKWAESLMTSGFDSVSFQATTRTPLLIDSEIKSGRTFDDVYGEASSNYLYNFTKDDYDRVIVLHETDPWNESCDLAIQTDGKTVKLTRKLID